MINPSQPQLTEQKVNEEHQKATGLWVPDLGLTCMTVGILAYMAWLIYWMTNY